MPALISIAQFTDVHVYAPILTLLKTSLQWCQCYSFKHRVILAIMTQRDNILTWQGIVIENSLFKQLI